MSESLHTPNAQLPPSHTAYELFKHASVVLLERGEAHGDRLQYEFDVDDNYRVVLHNYATAASHITHRYNTNDPNQINSLQNGESILTAELHNVADQTVLSYILCKPRDISRSTIFSHTIGEQLLDSMDQEAYVVLSTVQVGSAEVVEVSPDQLYELLKYIY